MTERSHELKIQSTPQTDSESVLTRNRLFNSFVMSIDNLTQSVDRIDRQRDRVKESGKKKKNREMRTDRHRRYATCAATYRRYTHPATLSIEMA